MNNIEIFGVPYLKKGSGIHIKKKNRGSFTKYCKGKVTQSCIDKAKHSGNSKLVKKAVFAENSRSWAKKHLEGGWLELLPIYGTYKSGQRFFSNPSWSGAAETGLSLLGDIGTFMGIGALAKGLSIANKANKATKASRIAYETALAARRNFWDTSNRLGAKIKHNEGVINSLTFYPQLNSYLIITQRIKDNRKYKDIINNTRNADKTALNAAIQSGNLAANLNYQTATTLKNAILPGLTVVPTLAAKVAISGDAQGIISKKNN